MGQEVYAIGNPFGLERTVTKGIVGAFRTIEGVHLVQTDAAINKGNSGGPLLLASGLVVGINSQTFRKDVGEGLSFAIAAEEAKRILGALVP